MNHRSKNEIISKRVVLRTTDSKEGTPKKSRLCIYKKKKKSRYLKLYCEFFTSGIDCDRSISVNSYNNANHETLRREVVDVILEHNPNAFRPNIANSPTPVRNRREYMVDKLLLGKHNKGHHCKKSGCWKKYR